MTELENVINVLYPLISGIGIIANALVIAVTVIWERLKPNRTIANIFVVNLAMADLLFLLVLPLNMPAVNKEGWAFERFMCKFTEVLKYINFRASILFLTTMTVDRYLAIVHSIESRSYRTRKNGAITCALIWILSISATVPIAIYADIHEEQRKVLCIINFPGYQSPYVSLYDYLTNTSTAYDGHKGSSIQFGFVDYSAYDVPDLSLVNTSEDAHSPNIKAVQDFTAEPIQRYTCLDEGHQSSKAHVAWIATNFTFFFAIPTLIIIFSYVRIIEVIVSRNISSTVGAGMHKQLAVMVAILVSTFIICWLPFQIFELLILPPGLQVAGVLDCIILKTVFSILAWSNSTINPILYSFSSGRFHSKIKMAWMYVRHGRKRVLTMQASQKTNQTRLNTTTGSTKSRTMSTSAKNQQGIEHSAENIPFVENE